MSVLGNGLSAADYDEEALSVRETELAVLRRIGASEHQILVVQTNLANAYRALGRLEKALSMRKDLYARSFELFGRDNESTLVVAGNLAATLVENELQQFDEARAFLRDRIPEAVRALGKDHDITFRMQRTYARCLYQNADASQDDVTAAIAQLEDLDRRQTRIFGASHPETEYTRGRLAQARETLARAK